MRPCDVLENSYATENARQRMVQPVFCLIMHLLVCYLHFLKRKGSVPGDPCGSNDPASLALYKGE